MCDLFVALGVKGLKVATNWICSRFVQQRLFRARHTIKQPNHTLLSKMKDLYKHFPLNFRGQFFKIKIRLQIQRSAEDPAKHLW